VLKTATISLELPTRAQTRRAPVRWVRVALVVAALTAYLPGFWWGIPDFADRERSHSWSVDAPMPLGPLAEIHNIIQPKPDRNLGYPLMHSFVVAAAYTPYLGYLWITKEFTAVSPVYPFGLRNPASTLRVLTLIAHLVSVLMGVGIILATHDAARTLWDDATGVLTALFTMLSYPMFYYSRTGNVDVPVLFFTALALAVFARALRGGLTVRLAALLGVFAGCALATKEPSVASFLALPIVLLWRHRKIAGSPSSFAFWKAPLVALAAAFLAFGIGSGWFVDPQRFHAHLAFASGRTAALRAGEIAAFATYPFSLAGHVGLARLIIGYLADAMTLPGVVLAAAGVAWSIRRETRAGLFFLPALTYLAVLFFSVRVAQLRYVMPAAFILAFFAARAVTAAWRSPHRLSRMTVLTLAVLALTVNALRGADLTHAMIYDSRHAAGEWLSAHTGSGDLVDTFGPFHLLPPLKPEVRAENAIEFYAYERPPRTGENAVKEIVAGWRDRRPRFILTLPDFTSAPGVPYSGSCHPSIYAALRDGSLGYREAAHFQTPPLIPWVRRPALDYPVVNPPIRIFAPASSEASVR
jgi:hypothetical protein